MSQNDLHINYTADTIRQYLAGELTPAQRHALEKAALDDPFLADALEGWETAQAMHGEEAVQQEHLQLQQQLAARLTDKQKNRVVYYRTTWFRSAAAILIVLAGAAVLYLAQPSASNEAPLAKNEQQSAPPARVPLPEPPADSPEPTKAEGNAASVLANENNTPPAVAPKKNTGTRKLTLALSDTMAFMTTAPARNDKPLPVSARKKSDALASARLTPDSTLAAAIGWVRTDTAVVTAFKASTDKYTVPPAAARISDSELRKQERILNSTIPGLISTPMETEVVTVSNLNPPHKKALTLTDSIGKDKSNVLFGKVMGARNEPLAGATIDVASYRSYRPNNIITDHIITDQQGYFQIPTQDSVLNLNVTAKGYEPRQFLVYNYNNITLQQLQLQQPASAAPYGRLNPAARRVSGDSATALKTDSVVIQQAVPAIGWTAYEKYLAENMRRPSGDLHGEVIVSFNVQLDGKPADFRIEKSLNIPANLEAIRLVQTGPLWQLHTLHPVRVSVVVRY